MALPAGLLDESPAAFDTHRMTGTNAVCRVGEMTKKAV